MGGFQEEWQEWHFSWSFERVGVYQVEKRGRALQIRNIFAYANTQSCQRSWISIHQVHVPCCVPCSITHTGYGPCPEQLTAGQKKTSVMTQLEKNPMPDTEVWTTSARVIRSRDYNGKPNMQARFPLSSQILRNDRKGHKQKTKQNKQLTNLEQYCKTRK